MSSCSQEQEDSSDVVKYFRNVVYETINIYENRRNIKYHSCYYKTHTNKDILRNVRIPIISYRS